MEDSTPTSVPSPDLYLGLGSLLYALAKIDGRVQIDEMQLVREILAKEPFGDLTLFGFMLREDYGETPEEAYRFAIRRFTNNRHCFDDALKKHFVALLTRVAEAHDDISRKEDDLIQQFRRDLRKI